LASAFLGEGRVAKIPVGRWVMFRLPVSGDGEGFRDWVQRTAVWVETR
jgi:hypothetical protein